jgi:diadenosine tetraphosphatase ApaH/serine/threonine PP2A family protein phosphatase
VPLETFAPWAQAALSWTQDAIGAVGQANLERLEPQDVEGPVPLYHASPRDPVWEYVLSTLLADLCLDVQTHRVCLIGHSHVALSFQRAEGEPATGETRPGGAEVDLAEQEWLLNPGSVGQPRDGDPRAAWMVLDTGAWTAGWRRTEYDVAGAQSAIRAARLPDSLAERLEYGQ